MYKGISSGYASSGLNSYRNVAWQNPIYKLSGGYNGGSSSSYTSPYQQSAQKVHTFAKAAVEKLPAYLSTEYVNGLYLQKPGEQNVQVSFLNPARPSTQFIGTTKQVEKFIHKAFKKITGEEFPENIVVNVCTEQQMKELHNSWTPGIQGFSLNRQGKGVNEVFVKQGPLDLLMLTVGHEIGHVMSPTLPDARDEEAKAFAFELAWIECIIENNIAGLSNALHLAPAKNGLHDVAFDFVKFLIQEKTALQVFTDLVLGRKSIQNKLEQIVLR